MAALVINSSCMNCLIYARVSTDKQAEKELSIPAQLSAMRQYAFDRGWQIVHEFTEAGASARTADRPILRQLLARCGEGPTKIDVILVHKIDRLARNLADHVAIRSQLRARGVRLASATESLEDSVSGQLVEHILASMAEFYSANLSEEVKKGMRQKILQGGWPHRLPRGYRMSRLGDRPRVTVDEVQGPLIQRAFEICSAEYRGLVDLRWRLATLGLRTATGEPVSNGYLGRMLRNPFYCGRMFWNGKVYPGAHPALVEPGIFDRVQGILAARTKTLARTKSSVLLAGIGECARCGARMGTDGHGRWQYYRCRRSFRSFDRCAAPYCNVIRVHQSLDRLLRRTTLPDTVARQLLDQIPDRERAKWLRILIAQAKSARDLFIVLPLASQRLLLQLLFCRLTVDATGIVQYQRVAQAAA